MNRKIARYFAILFLLIIVVAFATIVFAQNEKRDFKRVEIVWIDVIATDTGWHTEEYIEEWISNEPTEVIQVGLLYRDTEDFVVILDSSFTGKGFLGAATKIPKGMIVSMKELK